MSRGKYTWEETWTAIDQLTEEGWNAEDIFISRLILLTQ